MSQVISFVKNNITYILDTQFEIEVSSSTTFIHNEKVFEFDKIQMLNSDLIEYYSDHIFEYLNIKPKVGFINNELVLQVKNVGDLETQLNWELLSFNNSTSSTNYMVIEKDAILYAIPTFNCFELLNLNNITDLENSACNTFIHNKTPIFLDIDSKYVLFLHNDHKYLYGLGIKELPLYIKDIDLKNEYNLIDSMTLFNLLSCS